jgi:hypothetical protein
MTIRADLFPFEVVVNLDDGYAFPLVDLPKTIFATIRTFNLAHNESSPLFGNLLQHQLYQALGRGSTARRKGVKGER